MSFAAATAVTPRAPGRFSAEADPDWTINGKPNGGYLLAIMGRAATADGPHPHVIAASAHYVRSPEPGPIELETTVLRAGRSASQLRVRMLQGDHACVEALITASRLEDSVPFWSGDIDVPQLAAPDACLRVPGRTPSGVAAAIMEQVDLRIDPADTGFARGQPSGRGVLRGWLTLPAGENFDPNSLLYAVDAFPPATFEVAQSGWVPTLELTAYVRALPAPGPVRVLHKAQLIEAQKVDEVCLVWDAEGRLVAQATQLAGIRLG